MAVGTDGRWQFSRERYAISYFKHLLYIIYIYIIYSNILLYRFLYSNRIPTSEETAICHLYHTVPCGRKFALTS